MKLPFQSNLACINFSSTPVSQQRKTSACEGEAGGDYLIAVLPFPHSKQKLLLQVGCRAENKCVFVIIHISPGAKNHTDPATKGFKRHKRHAYTASCLHRIISILYCLQFADSDDFSPEQTAAALPDTADWGKGALELNELQINPLWELFLHRQPFILTQPAFCSVSGSQPLLIKGLLLSCFVPSLCRTTNLIHVDGGEEVCLRCVADASAAFPPSRDAFCCRCVSLHVWGCFSQQDGASGFPSRLCDAPAPRQEQITRPKTGPRAQKNHC